jgi:hypothetical protein
VTHEDVQSELEKVPFKPLRLHLVSGKEIDVMMPGVAWMLQNAVMTLHDPSTDRYDSVALRNIERLEQLAD